ncbi:translation initiation factor IF-2 N-terminal domain-containing protein [Pseudonocardia kongjuensis]|uniref:translation initiation factor IF-2 N-terminal domain-containing protein n=1 Tax=Pseudonocardia kongjuensis TaxID=102227 RepID=UPI0031D77E7C
MHELAKELGLSSKQVLSKLQDLGEFVKSPSSTVEATAARKLRDAMTGKGQPGTPRRSWSHATGNNPYSPPRRDPNPAPLPPPRPPRPRPDPWIAPSAPDSDETFEQAARRMRAQGKPGRRPRPPKLTRLAEHIAGDSVYSHAHNPMSPDIANGWAMQWYGHVFEDDEAIAWLKAGLNGNEADAALSMRRIGWTPVTLRRIVRGETVLELWRKRVFSIEDIDRMLREQDGDGAR